MNLHDIPIERTHPILEDVIHHGLALFLSQRVPDPMSRIKIIVFTPILNSHDVAPTIWAEHYDGQWIELTRTNLMSWASDWSGQEIDWSNVIVEYK